MRFAIATACALVCLSGGFSRAQEVVSVELTPTRALDAPGPYETTITLTKNRPDFVKSEPTYRGVPLYGALTLGDAPDNRIAVVIDPGLGGSGPKLYVDANGDGSLTKPVTILGFGGDGVQPTDVATLVARYAVHGAGSRIPTPVMFTYIDGKLAVHRGYFRVGTASLGGAKYRIALIDANMDGRFNQIAHAAGAAPSVLVYVDKNSDGKFTGGFDASKPFRLGGRLWQIDMINAPGTALALKPADGRAIDAVVAGDLKVGGRPIPFDTKSLDGAAVHFPDDYKGKVVMLDFWATWCPPCREEVPHVVDAYNKYHGRGFEILGVSLDQANSEQKLRQFMTQNNMSWAQIYDGGFWNAEIAKLYGVNSIPNAYLVDGTTGTILATGDQLRGGGLAAALDRALAK